MDSPCVLLVITLSSHCLHLCVCVIFSPLHSEQMLNFWSQPFIGTVYHRWSMGCISTYTLLTHSPLLAEEAIYHTFQQHGLSKHIWEEQCCHLTFVSSVIRTSLKVCLTFQVQEKLESMCEQHGDRETERERHYIPLIRKLSGIPSCWNKNRERQEVIKTSRSRHAFQTACWWISNKS